jgi:hypothetical protein
MKKLHVSISPVIVAIITFSASCKKNDSGKKNEPPPPLQVVTKPCF